MISELFRLNCSTLFLLHPLGLSRKQLQGTGFINCYLRDKSKPEYEGLNVVFIMFKPKNAEKFRWFVDTEKSRTSLFIDEYDLEDGYVVLVYEFPEDLASDFEVFKRGEYSKFSNRYRATIPQNASYSHSTGIYVAPTVQWMIIHQAEEWKELLEQEWSIIMDDNTELWQKMSIEEETISIPPKKIAPEK